MQFLAFFIIASVGCLVTIEGASIVGERKAECEYNNVTEFIRGYPHQDSVNLAGTTAYLAGLLRALKATNASRGHIDQTYNMTRDLQCNVILPMHRNHMRESLRKARACADDWEFKPEFLTYRWSERTLDWICNHAEEYKNSILAGGNDCEPGLSKSTGKNGCEIFHAEFSAIPFNYSPINRACSAIHIFKRVCACNMRSSEACWPLGWQAITDDILKDLPPHIIEHCRGTTDSV